MKRRLSTQRTAGLTLVEVLVSIMVVAVAAAVFLPALRPARFFCCQRATCVSNLRQVGLGMRMWSNDHGDKFPWNVSTNEGGTMEYANTTEVSPHYRALSNELTAPRVLTCPKDAHRTRGDLWGQFTNDARYLSYFVGLDANEAKPQSILSGDRNLTTNGRPAVGAATIHRATTVGWTGRIHMNTGNLGFGDGSVLYFSAAELKPQFQSARTNLGADSIRLIIP